MNHDQLYQELLAKLNTAAIFSAEFPDETAKTTLNALWSTALGNPCSAALAKAIQPGKLPEEKKATLLSLVDKRINGMPLAFLTGRNHFMGLELIVEPDVLIPRSETELLGYMVLETLQQHHSDTNPVLGIDIGCGSGNLSCGIASKYPQLQLYAVDITESCVNCTRKNVAFCNLSERISVYKGDMFAPLSDLHLEGKTDIIISNPPYIPSAKLQSDLSQLVRYEPQEAFNGGVYGFSLHNRLIRESLRYLKPGGCLFFEFGISQERQVETLFKRVTGYEQIVFKNDKNENLRVAIGRKKRVSV